MTCAPPPGHVLMVALVGGRKHGRPILRLDASTVWKHIAAGLFPQPVAGPWGLAWSLAGIPQHYHRTRAPPRLRLGRNDEAPKRARRRGFKKTTEETK
jgi:hypothetical protein